MAGRQGHQRGVLAAAVIGVLVVVAGGLALVLHSSNKPSSKGSHSTVGSVTSTTTGTSSTASGFLHTSGTKILDGSGHVVQLTGFNVEGMESTNAQGSDVPGECNDAWRPLSSAEVSEIAAYGLKTVRLPISWGNVEPSAPIPGRGGALIHHWNQAYLTALEDEVQALGKAGMQVVLDMHQATWSPAFTTPATAKKPSCPGEGMPVWLNPNASTETSQKAECEFYAGTTEPGVPGSAWGDFIAAETYVDGLFAGDSTVVGQDVVNEPSCGAGGTDLDGFYGQVAPAIHRVNPHLLIILEDKENPGSFLMTRLPPVSNVVLSIHLHEDYWSQPTSGQTPLPFSGGAVMTANLARAQQWNVPLYVGEFYGFDGLGNQNGLRQADANYMVDTRSFVAYCAVHDISWTYWTWTQKLSPEVQPEITPQMVASLTHQT